MIVQADVGAPRLVRKNRRASPRLVAERLRGLESARLANGPAVSLVDLSIHGALFEVSARLRPGDVTAVELMRSNEQAVITGSILRTEVSALRDGEVRYRAACTFDRPLPWRQELSAPSAPVDVPLPTSDEPPPSGWSEVHLAFRYGHQVHGYTHGFHPSASVVDLWPSCTAADGDRQRVPLALLRRVAFIREFDGEGRVAIHADWDARAVHPVEVTFRNNEVLRGTTPGYDPGQSGFWIVPTGTPRTIRVFAISGAVREICFFDRAPQ